MKNRKLLKGIILISLFIIVIMSIITLNFSSKKDLGAQDTTSIIFDPTSGNYIIRYEDSQGIMRETIFYPATKIKVNIIPEIIFSNNVLTYKYSIKNLPESIQNVCDFVIEHKEKVDEIISPAGWESGYFKEWNETTQQFEETNRLHWASIGENDFPPPDILPGNFSDGFSFKSQGLPGIVNCWTRGYTEPSPSFPAGEAIEHPELERLTGFFTDSVIEKTIGPIPPPAIFEPVSFIEHISSLKEQAYKLGWIKNRGIANSLNQKLENAKAAFQRNNTQAGKNIINAFINELEAQRGKHLDDNAYYLLKINAEYLLSKL